MPKKEDEYYPWEQFYDENGNPTHRVRHPILTEEEYRDRIKKIEKAVYDLYAECKRKGIPWGSENGQEVKPLSGTHNPYPDVIAEFAKPHKNEYLK